PTPTAVTADNLITPSSSPGSARNTLSTVRPTPTSPEREPTAMTRLTLTLFLVTGIACAADWPQWLGPRRHGGTPEKVAAWKGDLKVLWRNPVGNAYSSPVVAAGRVFVHAAVKGKQEEAVTAFDATTGKEVWKDVYERPAYKSVLG